MALKRTSEVMTIGFDIDESAANTFTQERIDLQLDPLNREVFIVYAVDLDVGTPSVVATTNTQSTLCLTSTSQTSIPRIGGPNVLARILTQVKNIGPGDTAVFASRHPDSPTATSNLDYIGLVATSDMYAQIQGANNTGAIVGSGKIWGARAQADAATYAALVQSQVLSGQ
jgi:hypothetical protein